MVGAWRSGIGISSPLILTQATLRRYCMSGIQVGATRSVYQMPRAPFACQSSHGLSVVAASFANSAIKAAWGCAAMAYFFTVPGCGAGSSYQLHGPLLSAFTLRHAGCVPEVSLISARLSITQARSVPRPWTIFGVVYVRVTSSASVDTVGTPVAPRLR